MPEGHRLPQVIGMESRYVLVGRHGVCEDGGPTYMNLAIRKFISVSTVLRSFLNDDGGWSTVTFCLEWTSSLAILRRERLMLIVRGHRVVEALV